MLETTTDGSHGHMLQEIPSGTFAFMHMALNFQVSRAFAKCLNAFVALCPFLPNVAVLFVLYQNVNICVFVLKLFVLKGELGFFKHRFIHVY